MPLMESTGRLTLGDSVTLNLILWCHQRNYVFIDSNLRDGANRVEFVVDDHFWRSHLNSGECIWINLAGFILIESIDGQFECEMIFFCEKLLSPSRHSSIAALIFHVIFFPASMISMNCALCIEAIEEIKSAISTMHTHSSASQLMFLCRRKSRPN